MNQAATYFVNPSGGTGNYHLIDTSPAIDAGSGDGAPNIDKDGVSRPQGNDFDNGCYEFTNASVVNDKNNPESFQLFQNYPNPFNPVTKIKYKVPSVETHRDASLHVILKVYDVLGNEIATLVNEEIRQGRTAGEYEISFNGTRLPSGVYIYQLISENYISTRKMLLLK